MKDILLACAFAVLLGVAPRAQLQVLPMPDWYVKQEPMAGLMPDEGVIYVDDGSCPTGEINVNVRASPFLRMDR
ncbi:DUF6719 family protein [Variovorax rhizosphaerae]|uniref:DUF6719 family protein n=1 Tax=Variovorax rhizosphaerae TaxID=1836200 RepID=UPI003BF53F3C